jgi:enoyl-CoA hydratase
MTNTTTLLVEREGAIATITLNRPEVLHALNATMFDELEDVFNVLAADEAVRCILLTGSGERAFAAGADIRGLADLNAAEGEEKARRGQRVMTQIERSDKPVIALLNGVALGGGCELALACTLRIASATAKLGLPEVKLGLIPGYGGTQRLTRLVGRGNALRLILTGEFVPAAEALRIGLVNEVVDPAALLTRGREIAAMIATVAPLAVSAAMEAVSQGEDVSLEAGLAIEAEAFGCLFDTADKREGVAAFLEKRPAIWTGR